MFIGGRDDSTLYSNSYRMGEYGSDIDECYRSKVHADLCIRDNVDLAGNCVVGDVDSTI